MLPVSSVISLHAPFSLNLFYIYRSSLATVSVYYLPQELLDYRAVIADKHFKW